MLMRLAALLCVSRASAYVVGGGGTPAASPPAAAVRVPMRVPRAPAAIAIDEKTVQEALAGQRTVRVGLVGGGTVGGGIVEILTRKAEFTSASLGFDLKVAAICVGNLAKQRDFAVPEGCELTDDPDLILDDPSIDIVVEVMGGTERAKEVIYKALKLGKHVVTANKALIAASLPELQKLLEEVNRGRAAEDLAPGSSIVPRPQVQFGYEAAVCGGIPIIHTLQRDFVGDDILQISGIINGCTNYMLSSMCKSGKDYAKALKEAGELGYAEADPTLDVGGYDARSKLAILIKLAWGLDVDEKDIHRDGITEVTPIDFEYAKSLGGTVKLLGVAKRSEDGSKLSAFVSPVYVAEDSTLASVGGATNAVEISSTCLQSSILVGQGAGRFPTANSCVSDILSIASGVQQNPFPKQAPASLKLVNSYRSAFYMRIPYKDEKGIIRVVGNIFEQSNISIHSILQNPIAAKDDAQFVVISDPCEVGAVKVAAAQIESLDWCQGDVFYMPVL